ncbi:MAG TPA: hypothetical protein VIL86_18095 [Tepidisphaeraceae bacterium]
MLPTVLIFYLTILLVAFTGLAMLVWVPRDLRSIFRYKLWILRDDAMDAIFAGRLDAKNPLVGNFVYTVEQIIMSSKHMTLLHETCRPSPSSDYMDAARLAIANELRALPEDQRHIMRDMHERLSTIVSKHIFLGSPSGWLAIAIGFILFGIRFSSRCIVRRHTECPRADVRPIQAVYREANQYAKKRVDEVWRDSSGKNHFHDSNATACVG